MREPAGAVVPSGVGVACATGAANRGRGEGGRAKHGRDYTAQAVAFDSGPANPFESGAEPDVVPGLGPLDVAACRDARPSGASDPAPAERRPAMVVKVCVARRSLCVGVHRLDLPPGSVYGLRKWDRQRLTGLRAASDGARDGLPGDRFGGDAMNMTDKTRDVLRATGNVLAQALSLNGKATALFSSGDLTFADDADAIMVAGSPGRRVAGSPGRRVAGSPGRRVAGSPGRRVAGSPGRPTCVFPMGPLSPASFPA